MYPNIARSRRPLMLVLPVVLKTFAIGVSGGISALARAGEVPLEFVGNLISGFHNLSLDRLDPTYNRCF